MDKKEKITTVLDYLNHRMSVMNQSETDKVKKILEDDDITLKEVVEWYIDYVWRSSQSVAQDVLRLGLLLHATKR